MSSNYPTSLDNSTSLPYPTASDDTNSPSLAGGQDNQNDAVIAVQTLIGTNASQTTPTTNHAVLQATSSSASEWATLTSSNVTSATGTGAFVFASSPTLSSPTLTTPTITSPSITGSLGNTSTGTLTSSGLITTNNGLTVASGTLTIASGVTVTAQNGTISSAYLKNPYKFSYYRNTAWTDGNAGYVTVVFDTENFDTGSNYSTSTGYFTVPITGYYQFNWSVYKTVTAENYGTSVLYNFSSPGASIALQGSQSVQGGVSGGYNYVSTGSGLLYLTANTAVGIQSYGTGGAGATGQWTQFNGYLVSQA